jgi:hypothetical protein
MDTIFRFIGEIEMGRVMILVTRTNPGEVIAV